MRYDAERGTFNTKENQDNWNEEPRNNEHDDSIWFGSTMIDQVEQQRKTKDWIWLIQVEDWKVILL